MSSFIKYCNELVQHAGGLAYKARDLKCGRFVAIKSFPHFLFLRAILLGLGIPEIAHAQHQNYSIQHLSVEHGLSHPSVWCILQDSRGFLWVGTDYGLNRFDGRTFKIYSHDLEDSLSISGTSIVCLFEDRTNRLWIGTENGLNCFDRISETFAHFRPIAGDSTSLSSAKIAAIFESSSDTTTLWVPSGSRPTMDSTSSTSTPASSHNFIMILPILIR